MEMYYAYPETRPELTASNGRLYWAVSPEWAAPYPVWHEHTGLFRDRPKQTHTPAEMLALFPPKPGGAVEKQARARGLVD